MSKDITLLKDLCNNFKKDIVDGPFGSNLKREHFVEEGIPVLKIQNIKPFLIMPKNLNFVTHEKYEELKRHSYKQGDIVMTKLGNPLGASAIVDNINDGLIVADTVRIRAEKIDTKYLCYHLNSPITQDLINSQQKGATRPRVKISNVRELPIYAPKIDQQKQIVEILDKAFESIDKAKENIEKNLQNSKDLFDSRLNEIFSQKSEGWKDDNIGSLTEIVTKGSSPKWQGIEYVESGGILFITSENVGTGTLLMNKRKYVEEKFNEKEKKSILKKGDVLTNIVGASIGRTAIYDLEEIANINQAVCILRCDALKLYNYYLMYLLNSPYFKKILHDNEIDNARANLSLTFFKNLLIHMPDVEEQKTIVEEIKILEIQTKQLENQYQQKLKNLEELKKSILQKAFSGELI